MMHNLKNLKAIIMVIFWVSLFTVPVFGLEGKLTETRQIEVISMGSFFSPAVSTKDPFKPMVRKKVVRITRKVRPLPKKNQLQTESKPKIKPLELIVDGICGNKSLSHALVKYKGDEYTVSEGQIVQGKFKVINVDSEKVTVYSFKEKRRHTFLIGKR